MLTGTRFRRAAITLLVTVSACSPSDDSGGEAAPGSLTDIAASAPTSLGPGDCDPFGPSEGMQSAPGDASAEFPWNLDDPTVLEGFDPARIALGGPAPDAIRPIDRPCFETLDSAGEWLDPRSPLLVIELNGDVRAYPLAILTQHEIVNDVVGGEPVVVTYCPLCNSGLAFIRRVDGRVLDFGTSGRLFQSNLVMYDRQHKNLWIQFTGEAVVGEPWVGKQLQRIPTAILSWREFQEGAPEGIVLARSSESSQTRNYGGNPYLGLEGQGADYDFDGPRDHRIPSYVRVVGLRDRSGTEARAILLPHLRRERVVEVELDGEPVVVMWIPGQASAVDTAIIHEGRDVGQTGAFRPFDPIGKRLTFQVDSDSHFVDAETGSQWNILGRAIAGPLGGSQLSAIPHINTWWYIWFAFAPETLVLGESES